MIRPRSGRIREGVIAALVLLLAGAPGLGFASETIRVAVPQKGNWDTSISEWGSRQGFFKEQGLDLVFTYTEGGARGDTSGNVTKLARLETGLEIKAPLYIQDGEKVKVFTETGEFAGRA